MSVLNIETLKNEINEFIIANGQGLITGPLMNGILLDIVDSLDNLNISITSGSIAPNNSNGKQFDLYIRTGFGIYQKLSNSWQLVFSKVTPDSEEIPFTSATGEVSIDFTIEQRQSKFTNNPKIEVWNTNEDDDNEAKLLGFGVTKVRDGSGGVLTAVNLDGVFGSGYVLIY